MKFLDELIKSYKNKIHQRGQNIPPIWLGLNMKFFISLPVSNI